MFGAAEELSEMLRQTPTGAVSGSVHMLERLSAYLPSQHMSGDALEGTDAHGMK